MFVGVASDEQHTLGRGVLALLEVEQGVAWRRQCLVGWTVVAGSSVGGRDCHRLD